MTHIQEPSPEPFVGWSAEWHVFNEEVYYQPETSTEIDSFGRRDNGTGWKVVFVSNDGYHYGIPMVFGREIDALQAARAVAAMTDWPESVDEVMDRILHIGLARLRSTMIEALAW